MSDTLRAFCWLSTGSLKPEEFDPKDLYVNKDCLGWARVPVKGAVERIAMKAYYAYDAVAGFRELPRSEWEICPKQFSRHGKTRSSRF